MNMINGISETNTRIAICSQNENRSLNLSRLGLTTIPQEVYDLHLAELNCSGNPLDNIPHWARNVSKINLSETLISENSMYRFSQSPLMKINLSSCRNINDNFVGYLIDNCTRLIDLDVSNNNDITDQAFDHRRTGPWALQCINLSRTNISDRSVGIIGMACKDLTCLNITYCNITALALDNLDQANKLLVLWISVKKEMECKILPFTEKHSGLKELHLVSDTPSLTLNRVIAGISVRCKDLECLDLHGISIDENTANSVSKNCKNLQSFYLHGSKISDTFFANLSSRSITGVGFSYCDMSSEGVATFIDQHRELSILILKSLKLSASLFEEIGIRCPNLIELDLSGTAVTDSDIENLGYRCSRITKLRLAGCCSLTDRVIKSVTNYFQDLTEIDLSGCALTSPALTALEQSRLGLHLITNGLIPAQSFVEPAPINENRSLKVASRISPYTATQLVLLSALIGLCTGTLFLTKK